MPDLDLYRGPRVRTTKTEGEKFRKSEIFNIASPLTTTSNHNQRGSVREGASQHPGGTIQRNLRDGQMKERKSFRQAFQRTRAG